MWRAVAIQRRISFAKYGQLLLIFFALPCYAECNITNPGIVSLGTSTVSASGSIRPTAGSGKFQYTFFIKCNAASNYHLNVGNSGAIQSSSSIMMRNPNGDQMDVTVMLKSVGGVPINTSFNDFPGNNYAGTIAADQSQSVIVEFTPVSVKPKHIRASGGDYNGNGTINLVY